MKYIKIIEDCAEAHGAKYKGKVVGSIGDIGCFSFYGNKIITTGEGGMVTTKDGSLVERIKLLRDHGMSPLKRYWHDEVGYNYRMTNIQAAIGVAQLESIKDKIHKHIWIAKKYSEYITESVKIQPEMPWALNVYWLPTFLMSDYNLSKYRELIMSSLLKKNIESRPVFYPLNEMPPYKNNILYENSKYVSYNGLSLPVSNKFDEDDIIRISDTFNKIIEKLKNG